MTPARKKFSLTLQATLNMYYPGWDGNREILAIDLETYRSLTETWIKHGVPQTSARFKEFLSKLSKIPKNEQDSLIQLEAQARKKTPLKKST